MPIVDYNSASLIALSLLFFFSNYNRIVFYNLISFFFFGTLIYITNYNITIYKYLISIITLLFLLRFQEDIKIKLFQITSLILSLFAIIEFSPLRDVLRSLYRSSNQDLHYDRFSCFFLFPGDLGAYCAIAISLHIINLIYKKNTNSKKIDFIFIIINGILLILSQSRMGFFHLAIIFFILLLLRPKYVPYLIYLFPLIFFFQSKLSYLFREDLIELAMSFFSSDSSSSNKRSQEIFEILNSTESDLGYYEGSMPSFISRFGVLFSLPLLFLIYFSFKKFWFHLNKNKITLIVFLPLFITSFISAPFERPKLLIFSFASFLLTMNIIKKNTLNDSSI